jgi:hypothetical protein
LVVSNVGVNMMSWRAYIAVWLLLMAHQHPSS